ncbi:Set domain-containing protein [Aphelenchoides fujianensis]|nr:Set domain-containing protein [Aphelenchoides fujianensis]
MIAMIAQAVQLDWNVNRLRKRVDGRVVKRTPGRERRRSARLFAKTERAAAKWTGGPSRGRKRPSKRGNDADLPPFTRLKRSVVRCPLGPLERGDDEAGGCSCAADFAGDSPARICTATTGAKGFGLFAEETIQPDQLIIEMVGEIIDAAQLESRKTKPRAGGHSYFIALDDRHFVDATQRGNEGRFVNHSCEPNACMQRWLVPSREYDLENRASAKTAVLTTYAIGVFATRKIAAGEEITIDYQLESFGKEDALKCACGSARCRGNLAAAKPVGAKRAKSTPVQRPQAIAVGQRRSTRLQKKSTSQ